VQATLSAKTNDVTYMLGSEAHELERLNRQGSVIRPATEAILRRTPIAPGMRVLDLGTGTGDLAFLLADVVGRRGRVVGLDRATDALIAGEARRRAMDVPNIRFVQGDVTTWKPEPDERFDALTARLLLFHVADPLAVLRHHMASVRPGGTVLIVEFDVTVARTDPMTPTTTQAVGWVNEATRRHGRDPAIGRQIGSLLAKAGVCVKGVLGLQPYLVPGDPAGPDFIAAAVRSFYPTIERTGVATAGEVQLDTIRRRIYGEVRDADAVVLPPAVVGAWGTIPR
jgi:ubiquinone/menaquinone biosynthesis C-methylase UbiE